MLSLKIYYNPKYFNKEDNFFIYLQDIGMYLYTKDIFFQVFQKPTEEIKDIDLYASSREFEKIVEFSEDGTITWFKDKKDFENLKYIAEKAKFSTKNNFLGNTLTRSIYAKVYRLFYLFYITLLKEE